MELYKVRRWNKELQIVEYVELTKEEIARIADSLQINMTDIALIFLNEERRKLGLTPFSKESVAEDYL